MNRVFAFSLALALLGASTALAQQTVLPVGAGSSESSRFDMSLGYHLVNANAPPGDCGCFTGYGGFVGAQFNLSPWLGVAGEGSSMHASKISALGQNLMLTTYLAGPRASLPGHRFQPFGEFLVGGAHAGDSYFPSASSTANTASTFAYSAGGGVDFGMNSRFSIRFFDVTYMHTAFPNGINGTQRQLQINTGIVMHFGGTGGAEPLYIAAAPTRSKELSLSCSTPNQVVNSGQPVLITAEPSLDPDRFSILYNWTTTGGTVLGRGNVIAVATANLSPGSYTVEGRAVLDSDSSKTSSCKVTFQVVPGNDQGQQLMTRVQAPPGDSSFEEAAQGHLRDLFFNYDESDLRPDALRAVLDDAAYLVAHPTIKITIAGYADERGSAEYNLALGMQRAEMTRHALESSGVEESRIEVISYGKERPFCSEDNDGCYQQNRRAQFVVQKGGY